MSCVPEARDRVRHAAEALGDLACVVAVDVLAPDAGLRSRWSCEAIVEGDVAPPAVLQALADADVTLLPDATGTRGAPAHTTVVVIG